MSKQENERHEENGKITLLSFPRSCYKIKRGKLIDVLSQLSDNASMEVVTNFFSLGFKIQMNNQKWKW